MVRKGAEGPRAGPTQAVAERARAARPASAASRSSWRGRAERRPPRGLPLKFETIFKSNIILVGRGPKAPGRANAGRSGASPARENGPKARAGRVSGAEATPWDPTKSRTFFATVSNHAK
jgi:hypothetical protein